QANRNSALSFGTSCVSFPFVVPASTLVPICAANRIASSMQVIGEAGCARAGMATIRAQQPTTAARRARGLLSEMRVTSYRHGFKTAPAQHSSNVRLRESSGLATRVAISRTASAQLKPSPGSAARFDSSGMPALAKMRGSAIPPKTVAADFEGYEQ